MCLKKTSLTWKTFRLGAKPCEMNLSMHEASSLPLPEEWIRKGTACSLAIKYHKMYEDRNALTQIFSLIELVGAWYTSSNLFRQTIGLTNIFTHWHSQIGVLTKQMKCTLKLFYHRVEGLGHLDLCISQQITCISYLSFESFFHHLVEGLGHLDLCISWPSASALSDLS